MEWVNLNIWVKLYYWWINEYKDHQREVCARIINGWRRVNSDKLRNR